MNEVKLYQYLVRFEDVYKSIEVLVRQEACSSSSLHEQEENAPVASRPAGENCAVRLKELV